MTKLSRETEALLERGRAGTPLTPAHRSRLRAAILAQATGIGVVTTAASAAAWTSLGARIVSGIVLVAAVGGAGVAIGRRVSTQTPTSLAASAVKSGEDRETPPSWGPAAQTPSSWASSVESPTAIANAATPRTARSTTQVSSTTQASITTQALTSTPGPIRRGTSTPVAVVIPSSVAPTPAVPVSTPTPTLERDVRLLRDADLATKDGDPERALALLDQHAAAFPRSDLEPERSAERVFALCLAGRVEEARSATNTFLGAHPTGPLAARVKDACRSGPRE